MTPIITPAALERAAAHAGSYGFELSVGDGTIRLEHGKIPSRRFEARYIETVMRHLHAELTLEGLVDAAAPRSIAFYVHGPAGASAVRTMDDPDRVALSLDEAEGLVVAGAGGWGVVDIMADGRVVRCDPPGLHELARLAMAQAAAWQVWRCLLDTLPGGSDVRCGWCYVTATTSLGQIARIEILDDDPDFEFEVYAGVPHKRVGCYPRARRAAAAVAKKLTGQEGPWR